MTFPIGSSVELHPHDPVDIIPLLESRGLRTLPVLSTIQESGSSASSSPLSSTKYGVPYATFLTTPGEGEVWAVVVQAHDETHTHLRMFCSLEAEAEAGGRECTISTPNEDERAEAFLRGVGEAIISVWGQQVILGAVDYRWHPYLKGVLDADEVVGCTVFLAPKPKSDSSEQDEAQDEEEEEDLRKLGLKFDSPQPNDIQLIRSTCDVPRPIEYYTSRSAQITVLRPIANANEGGEAEAMAICWIMHHADGSLGALYTMPQWRRKGLAKYVVRRRIRDGGRKRDYLYVFHGNSASEALWRKLGWEEGWGVKWVVNREIGKKRGEVVIHRGEEGATTTI